MAYHMFVTVAGYLSAVREGINPKRARPMWCMLSPRPENLDVKYGIVVVFTIILSSIFVCHYSELVPTCLYNSHCYIYLKIGPCFFKTFSVRMSTVTKSSMIYRTSFGRDDYLT